MNLINEPPPCSYTQQRRERRPALIYRGGSCCCVGAAAAAAVVWALLRGCCCVGAAAAWVWDVWILKGSCACATSPASVMSAIWPPCRQEATGVIMHLNRPMRSGELTGAFHLCYYNVVTFKAAMIFPLLGKWFNWHEDTIIWLRNKETSRVDLLIKNNW